ncbi:MAG: CDP-diacylglycerol--glycerol-3-phosphate 3-phosphatidyltransferase [Pseudomonadota bacterium]
MIWTLPNGLTLGRILAAPVVCLLLLQGEPWADRWAFVVFALAAVTDFLDGWLARLLQQTSDLGRMLDPIADKVMVLLVLAVLFAEPGNQSWGFAVPALLIMMREVLVSGLREFLGDVKLAVTRLAKWKTTAQLFALGLWLASDPLLFIEGKSAPLDQHWIGFGDLLEGLAYLMIWIAAGLTVLTGLDYFRKGITHIQRWEG